MKKTLILLILIHNCFSIIAQESPGIRNSNYAGIQASLLNPASIAGSRIKWDVNLISGGVLFDNNFVFIPKARVPVLGFKKIIDGVVHADLFHTYFNPQEPGKLYNFTFSSEILGPSFNITVAKKHVIGLTIASRSYGNIRNVSGHLGQNAFAYLREKDLWNTSFADNRTTLNLMSWLDYGLHYATVIYSRGQDELKVGISLKYLQGIAAAYAKNTRLNYTIADTTNILFTNSSLDYGRTDYDSYRKISGYHDLNHGHGFGGDLGLVYVHHHEGGQDSANKSGYIYRVGISMLDIGAIRFDKNAAAYHLQADGATYPGWGQSHITSNIQLDRTLSAVFYNGDSAKSLTASHFNMTLPTALSIQADWNFYKDFFLNATIIKNSRNPGKQGAVRPDIYSVAVRYENKKYEVSVPLSLLYYGRWQPRIGFSARIYYFFFGAEAPWGLLGLKNFDRTDFYAGLHFFILNK